MKRFITILLLLTGLTSSNFAQDGHLSQFYMSPLYVNPALCGVFNGKFRVALNYREQWSTVLKVNPFRAAYAGFESRFKIVGDDYFSVGLNVLNDATGAAQFNQRRGYLTISYMKQLQGSRYRTNDQYIIAGAQLGAGQNTIDANKLWFSRQFDGTTNTPNPGQLSSGETFPDGSTSSSLFIGFNAGLMYYALFGKSNSIYFGGAMQHINQPKIALFDNSKEVLNRKWTIHAGGQLSMTDELSLLPSVLYQQQNQLLEILLGTNIRYSNQDWDELAIRAGVWTRINNRLGDSKQLEAFIISGLIEIQRWNIGLSYDITSSTLRQANNGRGAFEVSLMYIHPEKSNYKVSCPKF
ncbi:MAG: PorP/SprF family type IX secretion system membrane protein [Saprospiraceae bacterium]